MPREHRLGASGEPRYRVEFHPKARKELERFPVRVQGAWMKAIDQLEIDPFRPRSGADIKQLARLPDWSSLHRLRVGGQRCCYAVVSGNVVDVLLFDERGVGYDEITRKAKARFAASRSQ